MNLNINRIWWLDLQGESVKDTCSFPCCPATLTVSYRFIYISAPQSSQTCKECLSETTGLLFFPLCNAGSLMMLLLPFAFGIFWVNLVGRVFFDLGSTFRSYTTEQKSKTLREAFEDCLCFNWRFLVIYTLTPEVIRNLLLCLNVFYVLELNI